MSARAPVWVLGILVTLAASAARGPAGEWGGEAVPPARSRALWGARLEVERDPMRMNARELRQIPGVGEARALAIVEARGRRPPGAGPLVWSDVAGIGERIEARIQAWAAAHREGDPQMRDPSYPGTRCGSRAPRPFVSDRSMQHQDPRPAPPRSRAVASLLSLSLLLAGCRAEPGDGAVASAGAAAASLDLTVAADGGGSLRSFAAVVASARLVRADGTPGEELLRAPVRVELLGPLLVAEWIASAAVEAGEYRALRLAFRPFSYEARDLDGSPLTVNAQSDTLVATFASPVRIGGGDYQRIDVRIDLAASLAGAVPGGVLSFAPLGLAHRSDGSAPVAVGTIDAPVMMRQISTGALVVDAMVGDGRTSPLRRAQVWVDADTLLVGRDGSVFDQVALFLTLLSPRTSVVEVQGSLGIGGLLVASRVEVEDQDGTASTYPVELEGTVVDTSSAPVVRIAVREVTRGAAVVEPALLALDTRTIEVVVEGQTLVSLGPDLLAPSELLVGDDVKVKFRLFSGEPFQAARILIR